MNAKKQFKGRKMARKINDWKWFTSSLSVGIVQVEDEYDGLLYYIGPSNNNDEVRDVEWIASWGASFPKVAGDILFGVNKK